MGNKKKSNNKAEVKIVEPTDIRLDIAKRVVANNGNILQKSILPTLKSERIVRISMHVSKKSGYDCRLRRDSPYVRIIENKNDNILGLILPEFRTLPENYYPLRSGDNIWFISKNIIEILELTEDDAKYRTDEYVAYTGPLETVDYEEDSSEGVSDSESSPSDSDLDGDDIDLKKKDSRAPFNRGRII